MIRALKTGCIHKKYAEKNIENVFKLRFFFDIYELWYLSLFVSELI